MAEGHESKGLLPAPSPKADALSEWLLWRNHGNDSQSPLSTPLPRPWDPGTGEPWAGNHSSLPAGISQMGKLSPERRGPCTLPCRWSVCGPSCCSPSPWPGGHLPPKRKRVPVSRRRREARRRKLRNPVIPPNTIRIRLSGSRITKVPCMAEKREDSRLLTSFSQ